MVRNITTPLKMCQYYFDTCSCAKLWRDNQFRYAEEERRRETRLIELESEGQIAGTKQRETEAQAKIAESRRLEAEARQHEAEAQIQIAESSRLEAEARQHEAEAQIQIAESRRLEAEAQARIAESRRLETEVKEETIRKKNERDFELERERGQREERTQEARIHDQEERDKRLNERMTTCAELANTMRSYDGVDPTHLTSIFARVLDIGDDNVHDKKPIGASRNRPRHFSSMQNTANRRRV